ncbi:MAG: helix-turn-helix domain-containing protein [Bacillota bacterium]
MNLGQKIRDFRKERGITLTQLANVLSISPSYLSAIERNLRTPSIQMLKKIGDKLNVPVTYLVGSEENVLTGKKLKYMRESRNLTREELSEICDISVRMLEKIEEGQESPDLDCLKKLSQGLNVEIKFFLDRGDYNSLGSRLTKIRRSKGYTVFSLAEETGLTAEMISRIESGQVTPYLDTIEDIARVLNTSPAYLLMESRDVEDMLSTLGSDLLGVLGDPDVQAVLKSLRDFQPGDLKHIIDYIQFFKQNRQLINTASGG